VNTRHPTVLKLALLLALILPLQGFAVAWSCAAPETVEMSQHHCGQADGASVHHHCGTCCAAAIAATATVWATPPATITRLSLPSFRSLPAIALDRLDRPPRILPS
jgi:hypothetical protein